MINYLIIVLSVCGICVSLYGWYVERKIKQDATYKPVCDISDKISCLAVARSPYSRLFFISNSVIGMIFYIAIAVLIYTEQVVLVKYLVTSACIISLFLAYILITKIKSACPICITVYLINVTLFVCSYYL